MTGTQIKMLEEAAKYGGDLYVEGAGEYRTARSLTTYLEQHPKVEHLFRLTEAGWHRVTELLLEHKKEHDQYIQNIWNKNDELAKQLKLVQEDRDRIVEWVRLIANGNADEVKPQLAAYLKTRKAEKSK